MKIKIYILPFFLIFFIIIYEIISLFISLNIKPLNVDNIIILPIKKDFNIEKIFSKNCSIKSNPFTIPKKISTQKNIKIPAFNYKIMAITNEANKCFAMVKNKVNGLTFIIKEGDVLGKWKVKKIKKNEVIFSYKGIRKYLSVW